MNKLEILFWIAVIVAVILSIYVEFFKCGGFIGSISDIPRWCWWFR